MAVFRAKFDYVESSESLGGQDDFELRVAVDIRTKAELLSELSAAGKFPDYFGHNWDALQDCLRDLSWISRRRVLIVHRDIPLIQDPEGCRTYLDILKTALDAWKSSVESSAVEPAPRWAYTSHELRVYFPLECKSAIEQLTAER